MGLPWDFHPLVGERIRLDLLRDDDLTALHEMQSDPAVCRYLLYEPRTLEQVRGALRTDAAATRLASAGDFIQPAIRDADGAFVGTMYLTIASVEGGAEIGWILLPRHHRKGYAREAAALLLDVAFGELGLHRVFAELDPRNEASVALCRSLGMRREGHFVEHMWLKGEWTDTGVYAILEREWRQSDLLA